MAKGSGLGQNLYVGGYDLSGDVGSLSGVGSPRSLLDVTAINKSAFERINGIQQGQINFNSFFNDAAGQAHPALKTLPTADVGVLYAYGTPLSKVAAMLVAKQVNYDGNRAADGSFTLDVQTQASAGVGLEWGGMITAGKITQASAGAQTGEVLAGSTANGLAAMLHIFSLTSGTPTILVQHSSDTTNGIDGTWATIITFTINSANTWQRLTVTGTVNKGLRINTTGTFANLVMAVAARRGTAQDDVAY